MYCIKCGTEFPDDSLFCPVCGESVVKRDYASFDMSDEPETQPNKKPILLYILVAAAAVVVTVFLIIFFVNKSPAGPKEPVISLDEVADYCDKEEVYVEYVVTHIGTSKYYIFLNPGKYADFTVLVPEKQLTKEGAEKAFLGEKIRVFGKITKYTYEDSGREVYEIKVDSLASIMVVD